MSDKPDPSMKDVAETAGKLFKEIKSVLGQLFQDLKTKINEKSAEAAKPQAPVSKDPEPKINPEPKVNPEHTDKDNTPK